MSKPSFQFYPGDWRKDANLRRCSPAARGVWIDILCVMHDSDEYGVLRWPLKDVAQAAGATMSHVRELVDKGVLRGNDKRVTQAYIYTPRSGRKLGDPVTLVAEQAGPMWYSARMVKDNYVRTVRGDGSRFGDDNSETPNASPKPPFGEDKDVGQGDGSSTSSSASAITSPSLRSGEDARAAGPPTAAEASRAMRQAGLADAHPSHPKLLALLSAGITVDELAAAAADAVRTQKPFAYALATAEGRRRDAAKTQPLPAKGLSATAAALYGTSLGPRLGNTSETIDG